MADIASVLPEFSTAPFSHLIPPLERAGITTAELLASEHNDIAKKAQIPPSGAAKLVDALIKALHEQVQEKPLPECRSISLLDDTLDLAVGGGPRVGYVTEITGESGVGKTQFLLTLLLSVQLPPPHGLSSSAIYISTEATLSTPRLSQLLQSHPSLSSLPSASCPTLSNIHTIQTTDLESQDHILRYQLPVAITRFQASLVIIDSIAAHFRAELAPTSHALVDRRVRLVSLGHFLRDLAARASVAIVVANQVADRFENGVGGLPEATPRGGEPAADPLTLDHQQRWFTGWGDRPWDEVVGQAKTPSLGPVWTNQIAARIALVKDTRTGRRWMRVVFAAWCGETDGRGVEFEIAQEGVKAVKDKTDTEEI